MSVVDSHTVFVSSETAAFLSLRNNDFPRLDVYVRNVTFVALRTTMHAVIAADISFFTGHNVRFSDVNATIRDCRVDGFGTGPVWNSELRYLTLVRASQSPLQFATVTMEDVSVTYNAVAGDNIPRTGWTAVTQVSGALLSIAETHEVRVVVRRCHLHMTAINGAFVATSIIIDGVPTAFGGALLVGALLRGDLDSKVASNATTFVVDHSSMSLYAAYSSNGGSALCVRALVFWATNCTNCRLELTNSQLYTTRDLFDPMNVISLGSDTTQLASFTDPTGLWDLLVG